MIDLAVSIGEKNIITAAPMVWYAMNFEGKNLPVTEHQYKEFARYFSQIVTGTCFYEFMEMGIQADGALL